MGFPKGELRLAGRPILSLLVGQFAWEGPTLVVTAPGRERPTGWELFSREVIDPSAGQGPLRGVLTALENAATPVVVVAAVDMPFVSHTHLAWVARTLRERSDALGVMPRRGEQVQPFPSAFRAGAASVLRRSLEANRRSLYRLTWDPAFVAVDSPPEWDGAVWRNLNTPGDVEAMGG